VKFPFISFFSKKIYLYIVTTVIICLLFFSVYIYILAFKPNINNKFDESIYLKIPTGADFELLIEVISSDKLLINTNSFIQLAKKKNLPNHIYPGRYEIRKKMNNNQLINLLRSGNQKPLNLIFNNIRTKQRLAQVISRQIEADSSEIINLLDSIEFMNNYGFSSETIISMFIPNTYEFFWNTSANDFFERMYNEYNRFWDEKKKQKADEIGLSILEVSILASIVDEETIINEEMPKIAGVYINRLKKNYKLGADPTIKFALGDFSRKRILIRDLEIDSPYNTYKYFGLPPGPISIPSIAAINAVLNYEKHKYLYFCAKEDFSGNHNFAKTLIEHNKNAKLYQDALNKNRVYK